MSNEIIKQEKQQGISVINRYNFKNLSPKLTAGEREIIMCRDIDTLKNLLNSNIALCGAYFAEIFDIALRLSGHAKSDEDYENQKTAYIKQMTRNIRSGMYGSLTQKELYLAVERGMSKQYGDFMGVNYSTINDFIIGYMNEQNAAITKQRLYEANLKWESDKENRDIKSRKEYEDSFEGMIEADKAAKKKDPTVMVDDFGSQKFLQLQKEGTIDLKEPEIKKLKERTLLAFDTEVSEARKLVVKKRAGTTGDKIKPVFRPPNEENARSSKNRIFAWLAYNEFLKG